jgi:hypothetical protein
MFSDFVNECRGEAIKTPRTEGFVDAIQEKEHVLSEFPEPIGVAA